VWRGGGEGSATLKEFAFYTSLYDLGVQFTLRNPDQI
jgi:hypothetical protein